MIAKLQKTTTVLFSALGLIAGLLLGFVAVLGILFVVYTIPRGGLW